MQTCLSILLLKFVTAKTPQTLTHLKTHVKIQFSGVVKKQEKKEVYLCNHRCYSQEDGTHKIALDMHISSIQISVADFSIVVHVLKCKAYLYLLIFLYIVFVIYCV
jgi:hypothetical protein